MGYYTRYKGSVTGPAEFMEQFEEDARSGVKFGQYGIDLNDWLTGDFFLGDSVKWYDWKEDIKDVSEKYPALLFALEGEGEESGDIWKTWARNGRIKKVSGRIVFDEPDLDNDLPTPDVEQMLAERKAAKQAEIDAQIAALQAQRAAL